MHARDLIGDSLQMGELVIKKEVRFEDPEHSTLIDSSHEEGFGGSQSPGGQCFDESGMCWSTSRSDDRNAKVGFVIGICFQSF